MILNTFAKILEGAILLTSGHDSSNTQQFWQNLGYLEPCFSTWWTCWTLNHGRLCVLCMSWRYLIPIIPLIHMIPYKPWTRRFSTQPGLAGLAGICLLAFQIFRILRFPCLLRGWVTRHAKYAKAQQKHDHYRHQSHLNHITIPGSTAWSAWQIWPPTKPSIPSISDSGCHFIHFRLPPQRCCPLLLLPR